MSREVIDDVPPDGDLAPAPTRPDGTSGRRRTPVEVPDAYVPPPPVYAQDDALVADLTDPFAPATAPQDGADGQLRAGGTPGSPVPEGAVGPGGSGPSVPLGALRSQTGPWWRRRVALGAATIGALAALVLGVLAGTAQGRGSERQERLAATRLVVMVDQMNVSQGNLTISGTLSVLSTGGSVLLSRLTTPVGDFLVSPAVHLADGKATLVPINGLADCSTYNPDRPPQVEGTLAGTATVRNREGDTPRTVPADLQAELSAYLLEVPCSQGGGFDQSTSSAAGNGAPATVVVEGLAQDGTGRLTFDVQLVGSFDQPIDVSADVPELLRQPYEGNFTIRTTPAKPVQLTAQHSRATIAVQLTYRCMHGQQVIPFPEDVLTLNAQTADGRQPSPDSFDVSGWDTTIAGDIVRAAMDRAGCPWSQADNPASGTTVVASDPAPSPQAS